MKILMTLAHPLPITFHRAFDMARDALKSLQVLIGLGIPRVLTSGQERSAIEGLDLIEELIEMAGDKIIIMPGGGVSERNVHKLLAVGATEVHLSARVPGDSVMQFRNPRCFMGGELRQNEYGVSIVGSAKVQQIVNTVSKSYTSATAGSG